MTGLDPALLSCRPAVPVPLPDLPPKAGRAGIELQAFDLAVQDGGVARLASSGRERPAGPSGSKAPLLPPEGTHRLYTGVTSSRT